MLRSRSAQRRPQLLVVRCDQELPVWPPQTPLVFDTVWPKSVVAKRNLADPVRGVARDGGNGFGGEATRQEPEKVPAAALYWIGGLTVPSSQFLGAQVGFEVNRSRHASLCTTLMTRLGITW